jgi:peptidoglycan LD-endopeptidase LytH
MMFFPVNGPNHYADDFAYVRPNGTRHGGIDIFAAKGTPVVAVTGGLLRFQQSTLGGNAATLEGLDGVHYYYAHLDHYEGTPGPVLAGMVIGYVGNTGNAAHTDSHLHFQANRGGVPFSPYADLKAAQGLNPAVVETAKKIGVGAVLVDLGVLVGGVLLLRGKRKRG